MLFNSISYVIFLPTVFLLYWFGTGRSLRVQNTLLLAASYFFYASWDYRFLFLLAFSTGLDFYTGLKMSGATTQTSKRIWFWLSVFVNLGFLGVFKYYNFFAMSLADFLSNLGIHASFATLQVILPVGISFYTFHGLSYVIDIYKERIKPERNFVDYAVFVSFFPLLVAGPIERATHLLPQIKRRRVFDLSKAVDGLRQILWGFFKKIVIADNCAVYANNVFNHSSQYGGSTLLLGAVFFAIQIYCDFSGYSDIALGSARLFGFDLLRNFAFPYFSRNIAEFWRRWHISLSSWFRDYLYIPLGGSKGGKWTGIRNTLIIFIVSGFWHGANWTFIIWGVLNAMYIMPSILLRTNRSSLDTVAQGRFLPSVKELISMGVTFGLTVFAWIFFRANSVSHAISISSAIFSRSLFSKPDGNAFARNAATFYTFSLVIMIFVIIEWLGREQLHPLEKLDLRFHIVFRWAAYYGLMFAMFYFSGQEQQFIYFQF
jgi:alginate O-acetyltransferase complex protein AlgI